MRTQFGPFMPIGNTVLVISQSTAPNGSLVAPAKNTKTTEACQYRFHNQGNTWVHVAYGSTNTDAANAAVAPNASTNQASYSIGSNAVAVITAPRSVYWSSVSANNCNVFITPGIGVL